MNIVFLHIPKTAGQSVHHFLTTNFNEKDIFPVRVNAQALDYTVHEIKKYKVFSGHFDISLLDIIDQPKFVFTILRKPMDRILSYYFYLRTEAKKLSSEEINTPQRQGMKAVLELSPDEYFCDETINIRKFIDNHYDNFYMYYFAMRSYQGKNMVDELKKLKPISISYVYNEALNSLNSFNAVYTINNWDKLSTDLNELMPNKKFKQQKIHLNKGDGDSIQKRIENLMHLGATTKTLDKLNEFCKYDNLIYDMYCGSEVL